METQIQPLAGEILTAHQVEEEIYFNRIKYKIINAMGEVEK